MPKLIRTALNGQTHVFHLMLACISVASLGCEMKVSGPSQRLAQMKSGSYFDRPEMLSLLKAVEEGDEVALDRAIDDGADVNGVGREAMTPLMWALVKGNVKGFSHLLRRGGDASLKAHDSRPGQGAFEEPPSIAEFVAGMSDVAYLEAMLEAGCDPNARCNAIDGFLLHRTVWAHNRRGAEVLVKAGADVNRQNEEGASPFSLAALLDCSMALYLFENGGDPHIKDSFGKSVFDIINDPKLMPETKDRRCFDELKRVINERREQ